MYKAYSRTFWRRILIFCLLKGVLCSRWDPLPEDVRSVVSSNHLGEGTPLVFAEYHALLPDFRGDYGVKSELVEAATQEPIYKGSNTFLLPLYIPQGAIPLGVNERSTRSGNADSIANMRIVRGPLPSVKDFTDTTINRSVTRRILLTGRRLPTETRIHPTPPPSFLRSWSKREPESVETQDYVEEAKKSKQRLLSQRRMEVTTKATNNESTTSSPPVLSDNGKSKNDSGTKEVTRIKKIMTRLENQPTRLNISEATTTTTIPHLDITSTMLDFKKIPVTEPPTINVTKGNATNPQLDLIKTRDENKPNKNVSLNDEHNLSENAKSNSAQSQKIKISVIESSTIATIVETTSQKSGTVEIPSTKSATSIYRSNSATSRNTTKQFAKQRQQDDVLRTRIKPVVPSTSKLKASNENAATTSTVPNTTTASTSIPETTATTFDIVATTLQSPVKSSNKSPSWLLRRRATLMKEINLRKEKQKTQDPKEETHEDDIEETESIIDRVLNSASQSSGNNIQTSQSDNKSNDINFPDEITNVELFDVSEKLKFEAVTFPSTESAITKSTSDILSARQRVPIRTRRPIVSNPLVSSTTPLSYFLLNDKKNLLSSTFDFEDSKTKESVSTNAITTSTPKVSSQIYQSPTPKQDNESFEPLLKDVSFQSPKTYSTPARKDSSEKPPSEASVVKMKSPQDIVLEKLSELMKNATEGKKDNLHDIALEIEKLNEELASMGIHIIDAEFDGHKIRLRDQVPSNSTVANFSGATTIRYLIPNTKSKFKSQRESLPDNFKRHVEAGNPQQSRNSPENNYYGILTNVTVNRPTERTYFTLTHSDSPLNRKVTSLSPKSEEKELLDENIYFISDTDLVTDSPATARSFFKKERISSSEDISVTTTLSNKDATRTRTPVVIASIPEHNNTEITYETPITISTKRLNPTSISSITTTLLTIDGNNTKRTNGSTYLNSLDVNSSNPLFMLVSEIEKTEKAEIPTNEVEDSGSYIYFIGLLGIIPCVAAVAFLYRQRHKQEMKSLPQREERTEGFTPPTNHPRPASHNDTLDAFPGYVFHESEARESPWELPRSKLRITSVIGEGNFGMVWKAEARHLCDWEEDGGPTVLVAVKGVKEGAGTKEKTDLLRELSIMQLLGQHNNVVTLLGCCTKQEPFYLIMEYVMFGKLLEFLREQRSKNNYFNFSSDTEHLTSRDLTKFAFQIATGCEYMQSRGVIHRDLAARNILLDHNKICKIADFGLARSVKDMDNDIYEQKSKGPLPIRWMAPESLYMNIFTHKSDVWSFGILCWEIVTLGSTPYPGISAREVMRRVREGYRLERPEHCRSEFYRIVSKCWHQDINKRSSFATVKAELRELLDNPSGWVDLENFQEATYYSMHQNNEEKL